MTSQLPSIAIVGRANVGKSTLFNRLLEKPAALVSNIPGTTRDRKEGECLWRGRVIKLVDTGGLESAPENDIERDVLAQAAIAVKQADLVLFVVDMTHDPLPQDLTLAAELARSKKPVIVVGNKAEKPSAMTSVHNREWRLSGLPAPIPVSAVKGTGCGDLLDSIYKTLTTLKREPQPISTVRATRIALIGKPNVGKSSLVNAILGEERFITSPVAHTTREPNDVLVHVEDRSYVLIDTAGIRKMAKVKKTGGLEAAGVERTRHILEQTDVALFVVDASEPIAGQDRVLIGLLKEANVGVIIVANKWDLIPGKASDTMNEFRRSFAAAFPFLTWAPIVFVSAKTKQRVSQLFDEVDTVQTRRYAELPQEELNTFLRAAVKYHKPHKSRGPSPPKVLGIRQVASAPPTLELVIKVKRLEVLSEGWMRYLENRLRERFDLEGTPVVINVSKARSVAS